MGLGVVNVLKAENNFRNFRLPQDIENYLRNNSSDSRIDKIQEVGKDIVDYGFLQSVIADEITSMLVRRDQLHHQVRPEHASRLILHPLLPAFGVISSSTLNCMLASN